MVYDMRNATQAYNATMATIGNEVEETKDEIAFQIEVAIKKGLFQIKFEKVLIDQVLTWLRQENGYKVTSETVALGGKQKVIYTVSWENGWTDFDVVDDNDQNYSPIIEDSVYSEQQLLAMTVEEIQALAAEKGYTIEGETIEELTASFLTAQTAASISTPADGNYLYSEGQLLTMTIEEIRAIAAERGYTIEGETLEQLVSSFLTAQTAASNEEG